MEDLLALGKEVLLQLIGFLQEASPFLWATLRRQVMVEAFYWIMGAVGMFSLAYIVFRAIRPCKQLEKEDPSGWGGVVGALFFLFAVVVFGGFMLVVLAIGRLINPDWYAIQLLLQQF